MTLPWPCGRGPLSENRTDAIRSAAWIPAALLWAFTLIVWWRRGFREDPLEVAEQLAVGLGNAIAPLIGAGIAIYMALAVLVAGFYVIAFVIVAGQCCWRRLRSSD
jgi:hypothetical protein